MRGSRGGWLLIAMTLAGGSRAEAGLQPGQAGATALCPRISETIAWIDRALEAWKTIRSDELSLRHVSDASIVFFDGECVWAGTASSSFTGRKHDGRFAVPDGTVIDARLTPFAGTFGADDRPFVVMPLPEVWRRDPRHEQTAALDRLIRSVFVHEMTHTEQARGTAAWLASLEASQPLPDDLNDDIVQDRFASVPGFREAYETERDLFYAAAVERDPATQRAMAREAFEAMERRRAQYFSGANAMYGELEDLFLGMEGTANWAAYRLNVRETGDPAASIGFIRRDRGRWSQDEGLAVLLVIDALVPDWQALALGPDRVSVVQLLRLAVAGASR